MRADRRAKTRRMKARKKKTEIYRKWCRCEYCHGVRKRERIEKLAKKEISENL